VGDTDADLYKVIATGASGTEMPAFASNFESDDLWRLVTYIRSLAGRGRVAVTGDREAGSQLFWNTGQCGQCHMIDGKGGRLGPDLTSVGRKRSLAYLKESVLDPNADITPGYNTITVVTKDRKTIVGVQRGFDDFSAQLMDSAENFHSFEKSDVTSMKRAIRSLMPASYRGLFGEKELNDLLAYLASLRGSTEENETLDIDSRESTHDGFAGRATLPGKAAPGTSDDANWMMYGKNYLGWRYSELRQINTSTVSQLTPQWIFQTGTLGKVEGTPLVYDGMMYATGPTNHAYGLDLATGRPMWHYAKPLPPGVSICCGQVNRGFAALGNKLFKVNLEAKLVALDSKTGNVLWETEIDDVKKGYSATVAPLIVKNLVVVGIAGAEYGIRGFIDAYDADTGKRAWRFWTVPGPGEAGSDTWGPDAWKRGGGSTWVTGTYDSALNLIYWGTGNPGPDWNGDVRPGDNLYTCSIVALEATRKLSGIPDDSPRYA
jgi:alcohol dehydrogenase (cytochrome c)